MKYDIRKVPPLRSSSEMSRWKMLFFQGLLAQIETRKVKTLGIAKTIYCSSYNCISLQRRTSAGVKLGQSMFAMYWQIKERALGVTGCAHCKVGCLCLRVGR